LRLQVENHRMACQATSRAANPFGDADRVRGDARPYRIEKSLRWRDVCEKCCKHGIGSFCPYTRYRQPDPAIAEQTDVQRRRSPDPRRQTDWLGGV